MYNKSNIAINKREDIYMIGIGLLSLLFNAGCRTANKIEREVKDYRDINSGSSFRYGGYEIHYNSRGKECLANGAEVVISEIPIDYGQYMHKQLIMGRTGTVLYDNMPEILKQKEEKRKEREDWYQLNPEYQLQKGYLAYYQYNDDYDPARPIEISTGREIGRLWVCEDCVCRKWYADDPDDAPGIPITLEELYDVRKAKRNEFGKKAYSFYEELHGTTYHKMNYNGKLICQNPWTHIRVRPNGDTAVCSWVPYQEHQNLKNYIRNGLIDWSAYFNNPYRKLLRYNFSQEEYTDCMKNCPGSVNCKVCAGDK